MPSEPSDTKTTDSATPLMDAITSCRRNGLHLTPAQKRRAYKEFVKRLKSHGFSQEEAEEAASEYKE